MYYTRDIDEIGATLIELMSFLNSPRRDEALLREAGKLATWQTYAAQTLEL